MEIQTLAIPVGFIMLAALLCWWIIGTKGDWRKKLVAIVLVPSFGLAIWHSMGSYLGWPTPRTPPHKAMLLWAEVREPEPKSDDHGAIYLLLRSLTDKEKDGMVFLDYSEPKGEPRLYKLAYSRNLHQALQAAGGMMRQGKPVVLEGADQASSGGGQGQGTPGDGAGGGQGQPGYGGDPDRRDPQVYELPPPHPPEKRPE